MALTRKQIQDLYARKESEKNKEEKLQRFREGYLKDPSLAVQDSSGRQEPKYISAGGISARNDAGTVITDAREVQREKSKNAGVSASPEKTDLRTNLMQAADATRDAKSGNAASAALQGIGMYTKDLPEEKKGGNILSDAGYVAEHLPAGIRAGVENIGTTLKGMTAAASAAVDRAIGQTEKNGLKLPALKGGTKPTARTYADVQKYGAEDYSSPVKAVTTTAATELMKNVEKYSKAEEQQARLEAIQKKYSADDIGAVTKLLGDVAYSAGANLPADIAGLAAGPVGVAAVMATSAFGDALNTAMEKGYDRDNALQFALKETLNQAAAETLFDIAGGGIAEGKIMGAVDGIQNAVGRTAARIGVTGVGEGIEEVAQSILTTINEKTSGDKEASVDLSELGYEFLVGAVSGAVRGAPVQAAQAISESRSAAKSADTPTAEADTPTAGENTPTEIQDTPTAETEQNVPISEDVAKTSETVAKTEEAAAILDEESIAEEDIETVDEPFDEDSPVAKALRTAETDVYTAGNDLVNSFGGDVRKAVDALYTEGKRLAQDGSAEAKARLNTVETVRNDILQTNERRMENHVSELRKAFGQYGISNVVVDRDIAGSGVNGYYNPADRTIHLSADISGDRALIFVAAHELTHGSAAHDTAIVRDIISVKDKLVEQGIFPADRFAEEKYLRAYQPEAARHAASASGQAELKRYMDTGMTKDEAVQRIIDDYIQQEMAADFIGELAQDPSVMDVIKGKDRTLWQRIKDWLRELLVKLGADRDMNAADRRLAGVIRGILSDVSGEEISAPHMLKNKAGVDVAYDNGDGNVRMSLLTYEDGGRDALLRYLDTRVGDNHISEADKEAILDSMDEIYTFCRSVKDEYEPFGAWSDALVEVDENGDPVFSVVKANGEYAMNLDFSLVCKKRRTLDAVFNEMIHRGVISDFDLGQDQIVRINDVIREHGFETACTFCFVDSKRFRQAKVADDFVNMYNGLVKSLAGGKPVAYFNYGGDETIAAVENGIDTLSDDALDFTRLEKVLSGGKSKTVPYKIAEHLMNHPEDRKLLSRGDFMSSFGFEQVKKQNPAVLSLYNSKKGSGGPKASFGDVQYLSDVLKDGKFKVNEAFDVGGVRVQSFSDYVARLVFDYVQMIGDLAAKGLPAHAYTKEALFAKQFGLTGMKINMSLAPAVGDGQYAGLNADGSYAFAAESFDFETAKAIQNDPEYGKNCGTIAIGVSDEHIRKLLADPDIRMVIPYHKSGLNPVVAKMNNISAFSDYTKVQNTRYKNGTKLSKADLAGQPNFNRLMQDGMTAVEAANAYLDWCREHDYLPKFDKFASDPNYYKMLEDFTTMVDGQFHPQGAVKAVFPKEGAAFGSMQELIRSGLEEDAVEQGRRDSEVGGIVDEIVDMLGEEDSDIRLSKDVGENFKRDKYFDRQMDRWEELPDAGYVTVGKIGTENPLHMVGVPDGKVYYDVSKIKKSMGDHSDHLTSDILKNIPALLNDPMVLVEYKPGQNTNTVNVYGNLYTDDGTPITVGIVVTNSQKGTMISKVRTVHARRDFANQITDESVLYLKDNKKEINAWFQTLGNDVPLRGTQLGVIRSIDFNNSIADSSGDVKGDVRYSKEMDADYMAAVESDDMETAQAMVDEAAKAAGYVPVSRYHQTGARFNSFSNEHPDAGLNDSDTPNGFFFKTNDHDIGVGSDFVKTGHGGDVQMRVYLKHSNLLYFANRDEAKKWYAANVPGYRELMEKYDEYLNAYNKFDSENNGKMFDELMKLEESGQSTTEKDLDIMDKYDKIMEDWLESHQEYETGLRSGMRNLLNRYFIENDSGYDGIELAYDGHRYIDGEREDVHTFIVFKNTQIKSADPVTYDDNGNVIPLSERFKDDNTDIRFSKETRLTEENEYLKRQFVKRQGNEWAKAVKPAERRKYAAKLAGELTGVSASAVDTKLAKVWKVFEQPIRGGLDTMEVRYDEALKAAHEAASELIAGAKAANLNPLYEQYADLRKRLRETAINPGSAKTDIPDYADWRKDSVGVLRLSDKGISVDGIWDELCGQYPEFFDVSLTDEAERIRVLADVANKLRAVPGNPLYDIEGVSAADADRIITDMETSLAHAILSGYDLIAEETYAAKTEKERVRSENASAKAYAQSMRDADNAQNTLENERIRTENAAKQAQAEAEGAILRYTNEARGILGTANDAVTKARNFEKQVWAEFSREQKALEASWRKANRAVEAAQERVIREKRKAENARRRQEIAAARKNVMGNLTRLYNTLADPTQKKHVPEELRESVTALLENFAGTRLPSGKTVDFGILSDIREDAYANAEKEALGKIERIYGIISRNHHSEDGGVTQKFVDDLARQVQFLGDMYAEINMRSPDDRTVKPDLAVTKNIEYLRQCNRILDMVNKYIRDMNVNFLAGKAVDAREMASSVIDTISRRKPESADTFLSDVQYDFMTPETFLERLGPVGTEITRAYRRAQNRQASFEQSYADYMKTLTGGKYSTYDVGFNGKLVELAGNDGKILKVPKDQIMELYVLWNRPAARRHLRKGGAIFLDEKGREIDTRTMVFDKGIESVFSVLTEEDKRICDGIVRYLSTRCAEQGNEASMYLYGYRKFGDKNYFPMSVSKTHLPGNWDQMDDFARLENMGFTKKVAGDAAAPLRIGGIFDTADSHVRSMAAYAAYAPVNNDVTRLIDMAGVKGSMEKHLGKRGYSYLTDFIKAVEQNKVRTGDNITISKGADKLANAYKRAAVSWNISTAMKQPISIVRALNAIDGKYIAQAYGELTSHRNAVAAAERMVESSGVAKMKVLGFSDVGFGKSLRQNYDDAYSPMGDRRKNAFTRGAAKAYEKFTDAGMWLAGQMDEVTWTRIWRACELEVAEKYSGLNFAEQNKKVTERFNEVIGQTQVVDTILDNAPILRSEKAMLYTAFMSEPIKSLNSLIAAGDAVEAKKPGAKAKMAKAVTTLVVSNILLEPVVSIAFSMLRDDEDEEDFETAARKALNLWIGVPYKDDDDFFTGFISSQVFDNVFSFVPYLKDIVSVLTNEILGYDNDRIDMANYARAVNSTKNLIQSYQGSEKQKSVGNLWATAVEDAMAVFGVPAKTLRRDLTAVYRTFIQASDNYNWQWELNKALYNINSSSARTQKGFFDIMASAAKAGDTEAYKRMSDDLENIITTSSVGIQRRDILNQLEKRGYVPEVGSDIWYIDLQAGFDLETFNTSMTAEKMITAVYKSVGDDGVLPKSPSNSFTVSGETVKITDPLKYQAFAEEVGEYSYMILVNMASSDVYKNLTDVQKQYAIEKAYDYARKRSRKNLYSAYDMGENLFKDLYSSHANPSSAAKGILEKAKEK